MDLSDFSLWIYILQSYQTFPKLSKLSHFFKVIKIITLFQSPLENIERFWVLGYRARAPKKLSIFGARPQNLPIFYKFLQNVREAILWEKSGARALQKYKIHPLKTSLYSKNKKCHFQCTSSPFSMHELSIPKPPYIPKKKNEILQNVERSIHSWDKSSIKIKKDHLWDKSSIS